MALAAKIPYDHPYAGGFPGIGSQPLPTDSDCLAYLANVAAADGAGVEVGVAVSVDTFFRALKATPGLFEAIKASCILCGARTITGALVPLTGLDPTPQGGWASGDYSRTAGLTGDGAALYLDSNVANNSDFSGTVADPQNDNHQAAYVTSLGSSGHIIGSEVGGDIGSNRMLSFGVSVAMRNRFSAVTGLVSATAPTAVAMSRSASDKFEVLADGAISTIEDAASEPFAESVLVFARNSGSPNQLFNGSIAFYSIGTSVDLEALGTAVSNLITDIGNAL